MNRWDILGLIGVFLVLLGVSAIYWPLAMILLGAFVIAVAMRGDKQERGPGR